MARSTVPTTALRPTRQLGDIAEAADSLGVSKLTVRRWIAEGRLTAYRVGPKLLRVDMAEVDALAVPCKPQETSQ